MIKRMKQKEKVNFLLENKHYKRLHIILYLSSVGIIVLIYFFTILLFSNFAPNLLITAIASLFVGITLVLHRDKLVKILSERLTDRKRKFMKKENKDGLKTTLKNITPKNKNLKLNITPKIPFKEKMKGIKSKLSKKNKKQKEYIEVDD